MFLKKFYSKEVDFGIRIMSNLTLSDKKERISANTLMEEELIPKHYFLRIIKKLKDHNIILSFRGSNGGYMLNKPPEDITFKEIIEAINGPLFLNSCLEDKKNCNKYKNNCIVYKRIRYVQQNLINELSKINMENLFKNADPNPIPDCIKIKS